MALEGFRRKISRPAIRMELGGARPPQDPFFSWFGRVAVGLPDEAWPMMEDKPMHALCQLNLTDLPYRPPQLTDIDLLTVFIGPDRLPIDAPNGEYWCLRAYESLSDLHPITEIDTGSPIKSLPMFPQLLDEDFPCWEDISDEVPDEVGDDYDDLFENERGFKLGGWPTLIQSEIFWAPWDRHPIAPEYVFQIDTTVKGNWAWGDGGIGYFGRGTAAGHESEWALTWQSF